MKFLLFYLGRTIDEQDTLYCSEEETKRLWTEFMEHRANNDSINVDTARYTVWVYGKAPGEGLVIFGASNNPEDRLQQLIAFGQCAVMSQPGLDPQIYQLCNDQTCDGHRDISSVWYVGYGTSLLTTTPNPDTEEGPMSFFNALRYIAERHLISCHLFKHT